MDRVLGNRWAAGFEEIGLTVADRAAAFLPAPIAGLVGQIWWLLLIVFILAVPIGWKLGGSGRRR